MSHTVPGPARPDPGKRPRPRVPLELIPTPNGAGPLGRSRVSPYQAGQDVRSPLVFAALVAALVLLGLECYFCGG